VAKKRAPAPAPVPAPAPAPSPAPATRPARPAAAPTVPAKPAASPAPAPAKSTASKSPARPVAGTTSNTAITAAANAAPKGILGPAPAFYAAAPMVRPPGAVMAVRPPAPAMPAPAPVGLDRPIPDAAQLAPLAGAPRVGQLLVFRMHELSAAYTPEISADKVRTPAPPRGAPSVLSLPIRLPMRDHGVRRRCHLPMRGYAGGGAAANQLGRVDAYDAATQTVTLTLSEASRAVTAGDWDGTRPRRFELADPMDDDSAPAAAAATGGDAPALAPPRLPAVVSYDVRSLLQPRVYADPQ
jgi:hypothetical protein